MAAADVRIFTDATAQSILSQLTTQTSHLATLATAAGTAMGSITALGTDDKSSLVAAANELSDLADVLRGALKIARAGDGAGLHNSIFRGKNLGTSVTTDQWTAISDGTFEDLWIGDYWTSGNQRYRIAAFDYFLHGGDTEFTKHHALIVPDYALYNAKMNDSNKTVGGYIGSGMYTANIATARTTITNYFGSAHVLSHREHFQNAVTSGRASGGTWYDATIELMNEEMVYGSGIFHPVSDGTNIPNNYTLSKGQLPLFHLRPDLIICYTLGTTTRVHWWLRDVVSASSFARVTSNGAASDDYASISYGVRPAFPIG